MIMAPARIISRFPTPMRAILCCALAVGGGGSESMGATSPQSIRGGVGGRVLRVTRLDDDPANPRPGSFRWAVLQKGRRVVRFAAPGTIWLKDRVLIRESHLTIDGLDAPKKGVCIAGGALDFRNCSDIIIRHLRVRLGDTNTRKRNREQRLRRPANSRGLDCISLHECRDVLIDHVSASWSCDEILSAVRCRNVVAQWCLFSEPLSDWRLHPYGDRHACCLNASASELTVHHCLFAHYIIRGPQFEANDMRRSDRWNVQMEAVNNVIFDFKKSGSRYTTGIEDHKDEARGKNFAFQFIGNLYLDPGGGHTDIEAITRHGTSPAVDVFAANNFKIDGRGSLRPATLRTEEREAAAEASAGIARQLRPTPLFRSAVKQMHSPDASLLDDVLNKAGCSHRRDAVDERVIADVQRFRARRMIDSPVDRGGYPLLDGRDQRTERNRIVRMLFDRQL